MSAHTSHPVISNSPYFRYFRLNTLSMSLLTVMSLVLSTQALAQDNPLTNPATNPLTEHNLTDRDLTDLNLTDELPSVTLETIVVTARGINENILDTPFAVATINNSDIEQKQMTHVENALHSLPSVGINSGGDPDTTFLWMRGTGSLSRTSLDDTSVDVRIDGVSNGLLGLSRNLIDVEQVEVAKGPQGTLYGQNAEAGVVTVKTHDPEYYFEANAGVAIGSHNLKNVQGMVNIPISDTVAVRVAGMSESVDDEVIKRGNNEPLNSKKRQGLQAKIRWQQDATDAVFELYQDKRENYLPTLVFLENNQPPKLTAGDLLYQGERKNKGAILTLNHDFDKAKLTSTTAYHQHQGDLDRPSQQLDFVPVFAGLLGLPDTFVPVLMKHYSQNQNNQVYRHDDVKQVSQEVRLSSPEDSPIQWLAGIYYADKQREFINDARNEGLVLPTGQTYFTNDPFNALLTHQYHAQSKAVFGEVTYPITPTFSTIAGLRVSNEKLDYEAHWQPNHNHPQASQTATNNGTVDDQQSLNETFATGRLGVRYAINPQWRVYALQSRGHKAGGFADYSTNIALGAKDVPFKPATINATEIGSKYASEDGRLQLGVAVFNNNIKDDHIAVPKNEGTFIYDAFNVDSQSRGVELTGRWQANKNWQLNSEVSYTDAKVTYVEDGVSADKVSEGNRMPQVPYFSGRVGVRYQNHLDDLTGLGGLGKLDNVNWYVDGSLRHVGERYAQADNKLLLDAHNLLDMAVGVQGKFGDIRIWGSNLTDVTYADAGVLSNPKIGVMGSSRQYGLAYRYDF